MRWLSIRVDFVTSFVTLSTCMIVVGVIQTMSPAEQREHIGVMLLAITYSIGLTGAIGFLTMLTADLETALNSVERIKEFIDEIPQERAVVYSTTLDGEYPAPPAAWPQSGCILFDKVGLRYRVELPHALQELSFTVEPGQHVGIVGRTGSGKSTIMLALFRMVELCKGSIVIDDIDIADVKIRDLRSHITIIPQDPLLFGGTIRSNLDPFQDHDDEEILEAVESVGLTDRVTRDGSLGIHAMVEERGANFSVGERQLLCLARAMLKKCKVLLLDEATASVDFDADHRIQATIRTFFGHCTVLTVAHRLATIMDSDRILVMDNGRAKEFGRPLHLLQDETSVLRAMVQSLGQLQFDELVQVATAAAQDSEEKELVLQKDQLEREEHRRSAKAQREARRRRIIQPTMGNQTSAVKQDEQEHELDVKAAPPLK